MKISLLMAVILLSLAMPQAFAQHDLSDDAKAHFNQGHEYYKQGRYDDAISEFKNALDHDPKDAASLFGLGNSHFLKQDFEQAIKCYQEVAKLKPEFAKAHYALALAYRRVGKTTEAEKEFEVYNRLGAQKPPEKAAEAEKPAVKRPEPKMAEEAAPRPPAVRKLEPQKEVTKEAPRPEVKRLEPEKLAVEKAPEVRPKPVEEAPRVEVVRPPKSRELPEEILKKARPSEEREKKVGAERPLPRREARPAVRVVERGKEKEGVVSRSVRFVSNWGPLGRVFVWLVYYTLAVQVWIGIVVLVGLIVLWRRR